MIEITKIKEKNETGHAIYVRGLDALDVIVKFLEDNKDYAFARPELIKIIHKNFPEVDKSAIERALYYRFSFHSKGIVEDTDSGYNADKDLFYFDKELKTKVANQIEVEKLRDSILNNPDYLMRIKKFLDQIKLD